MPTLADIYSAINTAKRKGADFVQNPGTSLQQMLGNANDQARNLNQLTGEAAQETMDGGGLYGPKSQELLKKISGAYNPVGMTVWHGSPHIFERFDLGKIGTGEGAQAYGKGMYMAQNPQVAKEYRDKLTVGEDYVNGEMLDTYNPQHFLASALKNSSGNLSETKDYLQMMATRGGSKSIKDTANSALTLFEKGELPKVEHIKPEGGFYKVDLPDTHIRRMIDWDEPIKNQPVHVRNLAKTLGVDLNDMGGDLIGQIGKGEVGKIVLQKAGIPGIKYLDQTSRNAAGWHMTPPSNTVSGKWMVKGSDYNSKGNHFETEQEAKDFMKQKLSEATRNFVVFDPNHLSILERNSKPIK